MLEKTYLIVITSIFSIITAIAVFVIKKRENHISNSATMDDLKKVEDGARKYTDTRCDSIVNQQKQDKIDLITRQNEMMKFHEEKHNSIESQIDNMNEYMITQFSQTNSKIDMIYTHLLNTKK